ncbi:MAG: ricin B lectin [uncultured bacterium]|nr:MAG: ricin B lectin [uncultured bacterium]
MKKLDLLVLVLVFVFGLSGCAAESTAIVPSEVPDSQTQEPLPSSTSITETEVAPEFSGYYTLQTMFLEAENKCLEGNRLADDSVLSGAAFMNDCTSPTTGQLWKMVPADEGYYTLQTKFFEAENKCLEGNQLADDSVLGGAAFMNDCASPTTGQLWKLVPADEGYYTLQTMFLEAENKCLEGNQLADDSVLGGAAFMNDCASPTTGQLWKLVSAE